MISGILLAPLFLSAQQQHYCGTDQVHAQYLAENPGASDMREAFEQVYQQHLASRNLSRRAQTDGGRGSATLKYTIPCVVHVIHNGGAENISDAQVTSAFTRMNEDFRRMPETKGFGSGVDYEIEFELTSIDPNGAPHSGINRIQSALTDHDLNTQQGQLKSLIKWPQNKYLNIWIVKSINSSVLAYATFPSNGSNSNDGVVCSFFCWGTVGSVDNSRKLCRVGVHEFGHWLNLYHPFQPSPNSSGCTGVGTASCSSQGDRICDTPPTDQAVFGNPARKNTCNEPNDRPDRTRNYMDYADDNFKDEFTEGQYVRTHLSMENDSYRRNLHQMANLQATGTGPYRLPVVNFVAENRFPCVGTPVQFTDWSSGHPDNWSWTFNGGTPATSNVRNPVVTYAAPGTYEVSLTVNNLTGASAPFAKTGYIVVTDQYPTFPIKEDFNGSSFPPAGWRVHNPDATVSTFQLASQTNGFGGTGNSARMNMNIYRAYDQRDGLISPPINLTSAVSPIASFALAYAQYSDVYSDTLEIYVSDDCGSTWNQVFRKGGQELATKTGNLTTSFVPESGEWINVAIDLSAYAGKDKVQVKFETVNGYGNSLYIDDVEFREAWAVSADADLISSSKIWASPNPFTDNVNLMVQAYIQDEISIQLMDVTGRVIQNSGTHTIQSGKNEISLNTSTLTPGVYFAKVVSAGGKVDLIKVIKN